MIQILIVVPAHLLIPILLPLQAVSRPQDPLDQEVPQADPQAVLKAVVLLVDCHLDFLQLLAHDYLHHAHGQLSFLHWTSHEFPLRFRQQIPPLQIRLYHILPRNLYQR